MNEASPEKLVHLATPEHRLERSLLTKMATLKEKLNNFTAVDAHGKPVGDVRNLVLNQRQLCLVIVQPDMHRHWRFVLLASHLVQHVSLRDRIVFVSTTQADISYLPEQQSKTHLINLSQDASTLVAPVNQLPASLMTDRTHRLEPAKSITSLSGQLAAQNRPQAPDSLQESSLLEAPATPKVLASVDLPNRLANPKQDARVAQAV